MARWTRLPTVTAARLAGHLGGERVAGSESFLVARPLPRRAGRRVDVDLRPDIGGRGPVPIG
jgi:hypothetical protein